MSYKFNSSSLVYITNKSAILRAIFDDLVPVTIISETPDKGYLYLMKTDYNGKSLNDEPIIDTKTNSRVTTYVEKRSYVKAYSVSKELGWRADHMCMKEMPMDSGNFDRCVCDSPYAGFPVLILTDFDSSATYSTLTYERNGIVLKSKFVNVGTTQIIVSLTKDSSKTAIDFEIEDCQITLVSWLAPSYDRVVNVGNNTEFEETVEVTKYCFYGCKIQGKIKPIIIGNDPTRYKLYGEFEGGYFKDNGDTFKTQNSAYYSLISDFNNETVDFEIDFSLNRNNHFQSDYPEGQTQYDKWFCNINFYTRPPY